MYWKYTAVLLAQIYIWSIQIVRVFEMRKMLMRTPSFPHTHNEVNLVFDTHAAARWTNQWPNLHEFSFVNVRLPCYVQIYGVR